MMTRIYEVKLKFSMQHKLTVVFTGLSNSDATCKNQNESERYVRKLKSSYFGISIHYIVHRAFLCLLELIKPTGFNGVGNICFNLTFR
jgi:hypothetical protein